ncbi:hypothetical protein [Spiroplasma citri]|uniref:DinB/UmuC family translesion DNA polymerase n=1 Tax=Spiroplasma citri TaxID=2133 RepID=UPI001F24B5E5|nr:hypothetical protein [Spiroplasma citri]
MKNKIYLLAKHVSQRATKRTMIGNVYVTFKNANRKCFTKQQIIKKYTNFLDDIYSVAIILFEQFWSGQPIRLIGVGLRGIIRGIISKYDLKEQLSFESLGTLQPDTVTNKLTNKIYSIRSADFRWNKIKRKGEKVNSIILPFSFYYFFLLRLL